MPTLREQLTVLVPTCNRQDQLLRLLRYYVASGCSASLQVLDSSTTPIDAQALRPLIASGAKIALTAYPSTTAPLVKMFEGLKMVRTPHVVIWADDDFLVPAAFEQAVQLLRERPEISIVHGQGGLCQIDGGAFQWVAPYPQRALMQESAGARLHDHFRRYSVTFYSMARTAALQKNFQTVCQLKLDWHTWGELALSALGIIQGKAYLMDRLYMLRRAHTGMESAIIRKARGLDPFDWLTDVAFSHEHGSYEMFRDCLVPELVRQDRIDTTTARDVIKQAFWLYLAGQMEKKWHQPAAWHSSATQIRSAAIQVPGLRRAWRAAQTLLPGQDRLVSLPGLLRPASRYHQDFMPVVEAVADLKSHNGAPRP